MKATHVKPDESHASSTDERCHILELLNVPELPNQSIARARVKPGVTTAWHSLDHTSEIYYILDGSGEVEIGTDLKKKIAKNEMVFIPKNTKQRIRNTGKDDLIFLCFCAPRFRVTNYKTLE